MPSWRELIGAVANWLGKEPVRAIRDWLGFALALVAFGVWLWDRYVAPRPASWRLAAAVVLGTVMLSAMAGALWGLKKHREVAALRRLLQWSFWSAFMHMHSDPLSEDPWHCYSLHQWEFRIKEADGTYIATIKGTNVTNTRTWYVPHLVSGDSASSFEALNAHYFDLKTGNEYPVKKEDLLIDEPFRKCFRVVLPSPLGKGEDFALRVHCFWRGTFGREDDFVFMAFGRFKQGVKKAVAKVVFPTSPIHYRVAAWEKDKEPEYLAGEKISPEGDMAALTWEKQDPRSDCMYIIQFRRSDPVGVTSEVVSSGSPEENLGS